jgi:uncharacterized protein (DUF58 family)
MTYTLRVVLLLLVICILAGILSGSPTYFHLSYIWILLLAGSKLISSLSLRGVQIRRTSRTLRSQVGQIFEERYEVHNNGRLPSLWIEVRDHSLLPGSHGSHVLDLIGGNESRTYLSRTRLTDRGVFTLGPTILASGDPFGLFPVEHTVPNQNILLVYPMMVDVSSFPNPPGLLPGGEALRRRTPQITSNAAGVREYYPGDPLNRIHWVSTARRDRLIVKEFELDPLAEVCIFIDVSSSVQVSREYLRPEFDPRDVWRKRFIFKLPPSTLEYSVTIAASLTRFYLQRGRAVGLIAADQSLRILPADRGGRQLGKVLEILALIRGEGDLPLDSLIESQARHLPRGSTVVMVTSNGSDDVYQITDLLLRRGLRPLAVLIDGSTFGGHTSTISLSTSLQTLGVPVCNIVESGDLSNALSSTVSLPVWR